MIPFEQAYETVLSQDWKGIIERVPFMESINRILAEDIYSDLDMPPFDKSAMDGYACRKADLHMPLSVIETIPAGKVPLLTVTQGKCSKIMTGAMIPRGCDTVILVEDTGTTNDGKVLFKKDRSAGNICLKGEDLKNGELVLSRGIRITPPQIAVMASVGATQPLVSRQPRVGVIATGNELTEPDVFPAEGMIRNSNAWQILAQLEQLNVPGKYYGIALDTRESLKKIIAAALTRNDVILLSGGVSMGDFDFVPEVFQQSGIEILFKSIAIQPGKPTIFGRKGKHFVFGLPGNPVSSFVLFEILVKPFLLKLMGCQEPAAEIILPMGKALSRKSSLRKVMLPVNILHGEIFPAEYHGSAHIHAYTAAHGIIALEPGTTEIKKGEPLHVRLL